MWDVLYAIDASSSMGSSHRPRKGPEYVKVEGVKRGIDVAVNSGSYPFGSRVGVITFHAPTRAMGLLLAPGKEMVEQILPLTRVETLKGDVLRNALSKVTVGGATPSGIAIEMGIELLSRDEAEGPRRIKKLILVTDERSNVGPRPETVVNEEAAKRAIIDIVGVGGKTNRKVLSELATRTGGKFTDADSEEELIDALKPSVAVRELGSDARLLEEARSVAQELAGHTDRNTLEFRQILETARKERAKLNKRLMEVLMAEDSSSKEISKLAQDVSAGQEGNRISMREYAERVWPRASEMPQLENIEAELRRVMESLAA